jgi:hypothetical protein
MRLAALHDIHGHLPALETRPEHILLPVFEFARADVVMCGQTHMQFDRTIGRGRVVNAAFEKTAIGSTAAR